MSASISSSSPNRIAFIDAIRVFLTCMVVATHAAITYGGSGNWYLVEPGTPKWSNALLTLLTAFNQSYFMGFFFLLAGYFVSSTLAAKPFENFMRERCLRLGLPLLFYGFILGPFTMALTKGGAFWPDFFGYLASSTFNQGPLWFAKALLIFTMVDLVAFPQGLTMPACFRQMSSRHLAVLALVFGIGISAFLLRLILPLGVRVSGMQIGYFASYVMLYGVGRCAWDGRWLERIEGRLAVPWMIVSALVFPVLFVWAYRAGVMSGKTSTHDGGWNISSLVYAMWEPLVAGGVILGCLWLFRNWIGERSAWASRLGRASFAAYIVHAPILVACSLAIRTLQLSALGGFLLTGSATCILSFSLALLLCRIPGLKRIL